MNLKLCAPLLGLMLFSGNPHSSAFQAPEPALGIFEDHADVGAVLHRGTAGYDAVHQTYTVTGSGANMWLGTDAFQFAWKKMSGDMTLTADISFAGAGAEAHRKAVLMIRQSLDADSAYADVARHGDGLTSLQVREEKGANTTEIQSATKAPARVRIVRRGDDFYIWVGSGGALRFSGGSMHVVMHDPVYVGIGVCSHNKDTVETAVFSNVQLTSGVAGNALPQLYSTVESVPLSGDRRAIYTSEGRLSVPLWETDNSVGFHRGNGYETVPGTGGDATPAAGDAAKDSPEPQIGDRLPQDEYRNCFAHVSPDGEQVAFLSYSKEVTGCPADQDVLLRVLSLKDGKVRVLARFLGGDGSLGRHSWSPDSRRVVFISYQRIR